MSLRSHGDTLAPADALDFAVNVWPGDRPPELEQALQWAVHDQRYPDARAARAAVAKRHGRAPEEVLLTNGACEAFWLLAHTLRPRRAVCVHPSFTEPEAALRAIGTTVTRVFREPTHWHLQPEAVPDHAELVVLGNPNNPTGTLEPAGLLAALACPGRTLVVDESFIDFVPGERESLSNRADLPGLVVVRSLTKLWSLAGIRAGYLLAPAELVERLEAQRQPWSVNALACTALEFCAADTETPRRVANAVAIARAELRADLSAHTTLRVWPSVANFLLLRVPDGRQLSERLLARGIAVRPAGSFPGLSDDFIRVAVRGRDDNRRLAHAVEELVA